MVDSSKLYNVFLKHAYAFYDQNAFKTFFFVLFINNDCICMFTFLFFLLIAFVRRAYLKFNTPVKGFFSNLLYIPLYFEQDDM